MKKLLTMGLTAMLAAVMCVSFAACDIFVSDGGSNTGNGEESGQPIESGKDDEQNSLVSERVTKDVWDAAFTSIREGTIENYKTEYEMDLSVHVRQGKYRELRDTQKRVGVNVKDGGNLYLKSEGSNMPPMDMNDHGTNVERAEEGCYDSEKEIWYVKETDKWFKRNSPEWKLGDFGSAFEIMADDRYEWGYDAFSYSETEKAYVLNKSYDLDWIPFVGKQSLKFGDGKIVAMEFVADSIEMTSEEWFNRTVITVSMTVVYGGQTVTLPTPDQIVDPVDSRPSDIVSERVTKDVWDEAFAAFYEGRIENYKADFQFDTEVWGQAGDEEYHGTRESSGINVKNGDDKYMETIMTSTGYMADAPGEQAGILEKGYYDSRHDCWYKQVAREWVLNASSTWETLNFNEFFAFVMEIAEWNYEEAEFSARDGYVLEADIDEDDGDIVATGRAELHVCFKDGKIISLECVVDARSHAHSGEAQTVHYVSSMTVVYGGQKIPSIAVSE